MFRKTHGLATLKAKLHDGFTRVRAGLAGPAERRRLQQWQQLRREQIAQAPRRDPLTNNPDQPIDLVPAETAAPRRTAPTSPAAPQVSLGELTARIDLYVDVTRYRNSYTGEHPEVMRPFDHDNARMRARILADARKLGPDQAALIETALDGIDRVHRDQPGHQVRPDPVEQDQKPEQRQRTAATDVEQSTAASAPVENEPAAARYEVQIATKDFWHDHPDKVERIPAATFAEARDVLLDRLADGKEGWPKNAELGAYLYEAGSDKALYGSTGSKDVVMDQVLDWEARHQNSPFGRIDQLQDQLHAARTENDRLRVENTGLVRKFAENDLAQKSHPATAAAPSMPGGPKLARPIFSGPVLPRAAMNGLDR